MNMKGGFLLGICEELMVGGQDTFFGFLNLLPNKTYAMPPSASRDDAFLGAIPQRKRRTDRRREGSSNPFLRLVAGCQLA